MFSYIRPLLEGYYHYSESKKNYFLSKSTGNSNYKELSEDELLTAKEIFNEFGAPELARLCVKDKIVNYPYSPILYDEYLIIFHGLITTRLAYPETLVTSEIGYLKFNYRYCFNIPPKGLPMIRFCCADFCSDWIKIEDNDMREVKIPVQSDTPSKIHSDILIYGEDKPDIAIGSIEDFYRPTLDLELEISDNTWNFNLVETCPCETVDITIEKPLIDRIKYWLEVFALPLVILVSVFGVIKYLKSREKIQESNIRSKKKKRGKGGKSKKKK